MYTNVFLGAFYRPKFNLLVINQNKLLSTDLKNTILLTCLYEENVDDGKCKHALNILGQNMLEVHLVINHAFVFLSNTFEKCSKKMFPCQGPMLSTIYQSTLSKRIYAEISPFRSSKLLLNFLK